MGPISLERTVQERYLSGETIRAIAKDLKIGRRRVSSIIRKNGIDVRPHKFPKGEDHPDWKGGRNQDPDGYIRVWLAETDPMFSMASCGKNSVLEHRLVMARAIGRPLTESETVHHINGVVDDNKLENLQLRFGNHGEGQVLKCGDCGSSNIVHERIAEPAADNWWNHLYDEEFV